KQQTAYEVQTWLEFRRVLCRSPGRLLDHLQKGTVSLDALNMLVMDEADRMLDMGFSDAIDDVIRFAPASRQTLLFSATWPEAIKIGSASSRGGPSGAVGNVDVV